ncbi:hypothetical protein GCK72_019561 [Caenorhabditis remanei]|uniref:BRCT domain-containing protein n=1 Tax=Caenorhabditis remanei TaxID=31234 RepID=A0A6A5GE65_CAERE|nr:hypothetical protein GCK72_019561 [Caenorhabditis remanei]KAF1753006.1 hypothetical protein GCK72_019561 [Caenorhabditis remanei]
MLGIALCDFISMIMAISVKNIITNFYRDECTPPLTMFVYRLFWILMHFRDDVIRCSTWLGVLMACIRFMALRFVSRPGFKKVSNISFGFYATGLIFLISSAMSTINSMRTKIVDIGPWTPDPSCPDKSTETWILHELRASDAFAANNGILSRITMFINGLFSRVDNSMHIITNSNNSVDLRNQEDTTDNIKTERTTALVIFMAVTFFIASLPAGIFTLFQVMYTDVGFLHLSTFVDHFCNAILTANASIHCVICFTMSSDYRRMVLEILRIRTISSHIYLNLFLLTVNNTNDLAPSDLQLINENFRILSRVTNAISFQAAVIRKEVTVHEFLSELLHVNATRFESIVNVDVKSARLELDRMYAESEKYKRNKTTIDMMKKTVGDVKFVDEVMKHLNSFSEQVESNPGDIVKLVKEEIKNVSNLNVFNNSCIKINEKTVDEFLDLFDRRKESPIAANMAERIKNFIKLVSTGDIQKCIEVLPDVGREFQTLSIWKANEKYEELNELKNIVMKFATVIKFWRDIADERIDKIRNEMKATKSIWSGPQSSNLQSQYYKNVKSVFRTLHMSVSEKIEHKNDRTEQPFANTAGFQDTKDLIKVLNDLKSPWFQKNIARGSDIKAIADALKPFQDISKEVIALESKWIQFIDQTDVLLDDSNVEYHAEKLRNTAAIASNHLDHIKILNDSKLILQMCLGSTKPVNLNNFILFESQQHKIVDFLDRISEAKEEIFELISLLLRGSKSYEKNFKTVKDRLLEFLNKKMDNSTNEANAIRERNRFENSFNIIKRQRGVDVPKVLGSVMEFLKTMKEIRTNSKSLNVKTNVSIGEILKESNMTVIAKCMREKEFQTQSLLKTVESVRSVGKIPGKEDVGRIHEYLKSLEKVQKTLESIDSHVMAMHLNQKLDESDLILSLKNSKSVSETIGLCTRALENFEKARLSKKRLLSVKSFSNDINGLIMDLDLKNWADHQHVLLHMFNQLNDVNKIARKVLNESILKMTTIFERASEVEGIRGSQETLYRLYRSINNTIALDRDVALKYFEDVLPLDLDFSKYQAHLKSGHISVTSLMEYYDEIFGHSTTKVVEKYVGISWIAILGICFGLLLLVLIGMIALYGLTENGKTKYKNLYLYYFGKPADFEKRWRYSKFMDNVNDKNLVLDAIREGNKTNLLKALKNGAYINVYNIFGNTALHAATKLGHPELVELLIKNGADRKMLNIKNRTAEQMVPPNYRETDKDKIEQFEKIQTVYKRHKKKNYRIRVPQIFPSPSFHIYIEDRTDDALTEKFMKQFSSITSDEKLSTTTHCVVQTDSTGVLETDSLDLLVWIFSGVIIMKEQWMTACLENEYLIDQDYKYLVEKVKYKGVIYESILSWTEAMAKSTIPYLIGVYVAVAMNSCENLMTISSLVYSQGGTMMDVFPLKEMFTINSRPYLHANLGPIFLIGDGSMDLTPYKNDPDNMYTVFTEEEFIIFMLKREIKRDTNQNPMSCLKAVQS